MDAPLLNVYIGYRSRRRKKAMLSVILPCCQEGRIRPTITTISCHWQTSATRCIAANVLQTNTVDAQCDKLSTELS